MTTLDFAAIEGRRQQLHMRINCLSREAGITARYYRYARKGERQLSERTLKRLIAAIEEENLDRPDDLGTLFKMVQKVAANALGVSTAVVLRYKPGRRATRDHEWILGSLVNEAVCWFMNGQLGYRSKEIASVVGMSPQGVGAASDRFEFKDDTQTRQVRRRLEQWWGGDDFATQ